MIRRSRNARPPSRFSLARSGRLQWAAILSVASACWFWPAPPPTPPAPAGSRTDWDGFLALSYGGVSRRGEDGAVSTERLREHLRALKDAGYHAVPLAEATEFLKLRTPLPEKALLLIFEDGRRETALAAEEVLRELRWPAILFLRPDAMEKSDQCYPTWRDLRRLTATGRWSFGSRGFRARECVDLDGGTGRGLFLVSRAFSPEKRRPETDGEWAARVREDVSGSAELIGRRLGGTAPGAFAFPCSDDGSSMADGGEALRRTVAAAYPVAFARAGYAFNSRRRPPLHLTRLEADPRWRGAEVVGWLDAQGARRAPCNGGGSEKDWVLAQGRLAAGGGRVVLRSGGRSGAEAWLAGSESWRCVSGEVTLETRPDAQAWVYLRAEPGRRYLRVGWSGRRIEVQTLDPEGGLTVLGFGAVAEGASRARVVFDLLDRRVRFAVLEGGAGASGSCPLPRELDEGLAGLGTWCLEPQAEDTVAFEGLRLEPRIPRLRVVRTLEEAQAGDPASVDVLSPEWYELTASGDLIRPLGNPDPALVHFAAFHGSSLWPLVRLRGRPAADSLRSVARSLAEIARGGAYDGFLLDPGPALDGAELEELLALEADVPLGLLLRPGGGEAWAARFRSRASRIALFPSAAAAALVPPERLLFFREAER